jgi:hypothetical protein
MDMRSKNLRDMSPGPEMGKDVRDTKQLSSVGKDALYGTNELKQYETSGKVSGPYGGKPSGK